MLDVNGQLYGQIAAGYQSVLNSFNAATPGIIAGYNTLGANVQKTIQGVDTSSLQAAADVYAQQQGATQQQMINAGLGNSTVLQSLTRGNTLDYSKATTAIQNQYAQLLAGYQSQIGLASLGYQANAQAQAAGIGTAEYSTLAGFDQALSLNHSASGGSSQQGSQGNQGSQGSQYPTGPSYGSSQGTGSGAAGNAGLMGDYGPAGYTQPSDDESEALTPDMADVSYGDYSDGGDYGGD
jgi:hypothetical protein